jgi:hypothetical protein
MLGFCAAAFLLVQSPSLYAAEPAAPGGATIAGGEELHELPPEGWWVPATLKLPKAAEGRIAWRFTLREIITVDKNNKLERRPSDLKVVRPHTFTTQLPVPMLIEYDDKQNLLTVTVLKPKAAFFTLNPAGASDIERFDKLVVNVHADSGEVRTLCDKATRCCRMTGHDELIPANDQRTLTSCRDVMSTIRQDLASQHRAIPTICR